MRRGPCHRGEGIFGVGQLQEVPGLEASRSLLTRGQGGEIRTQAASIIVSSCLCREGSEREEVMLGSFLLSCLKRGESRLCLSVEKRG